VVVDSIPLIAGGRARLLRIPLRSFFEAWGDAQVLHWSNPLEDEAVLLRAQLTERSMKRGRPGSLVVTSRRLLWITGTLRLSRALEIPREALLGIDHDTSVELPIQIRYIGPGGDAEALHLRTYSYWEAVGAGAAGGAASGSAGAAVGTAVRLGAGAVAIRRQRRNAHVVAAVRAGLGLRPEAGTLSLPQDIGGPTWKSVLVMPGFGIATLLALAGLAGALAWHTSEASQAVVYRAAPPCGEATQDACIRTQSATVITKGSGRHGDGSAGARAWLLLELDDGSRAYADLYEPESTAIPPGEAVTVKRWGGSITEVDASGVAIETFKNPLARSDNSRWAVVVAGFFVLLSGLCTLFTLLGFWRTSQLRWTDPIASAQA
jgi:hypothetical protein